MLILRVPGDEASLALGFGQLLSWASFRLFERLSADRARTTRADLLGIKKAPLPRWYRAFAARATITVTLLTLAVAVLSPSPNETVALIVAALFVLLLAVYLALRTTWYDRYLFAIAFAMLLLSSVVKVFWLGTNPPEALVREAPPGLFGLRPPARAAAGCRHRNVSGRLINGNARHSAAVAS